MTTVTIDRSTGDKLRGITGPVELRDERGTLLGEFRPVRTGSDYVGLDSPLDEEELRRREAETEVYGTPELLRKLESL